MTRSRRRRLALIAFAAATLAGPAMAQETVPDADVEARCETLLSKMRRAYADAPAVVVKCVESQLVSGYQFDPVEHVVRIDQDKRAYIQDVRNRLWAYDGAFLFEHVGRPGEYAKERYAGDLMDAFAKFKAVSLLFVSLAIEQPRDLLMNQLNLGTAGLLRHVECGPHVLEDGREVQRLHLQSASGDVRIDVDPETWGIVRMQADYKNPDDILEYHKVFTVETRFVDEIDEPVVHDPSGKVELPSVFVLIQDPKKRGSVGLRHGAKLIAAGDAAPAFDTRWISGKKYRFQPADGRWKLLAFWRSDHSATEAVLAQCRELADWSKTEGVSLDVLPVNAKEVPVGAERWDRAIEYWEQADIGLDTIFDERDEIAALYRTDPLPAIVLVDPQGIVRIAEAGVVERFAERVREAVAPR